MTPGSGVLPKTTMLVLAALLLGPSPSRGQLPTATAASLGMADNYTAIARGFSAISLNPAGLGLPETPTFSLAVLPARAGQSLHPISLSDIGDFGGKLVPTSVKTAWLDRIASAGGQTGGGTAGVTAFAVNYEFTGVQFSTMVGANTMLSDAAAELVLFGNAGRTGAPNDFDLRGSRLSAFAVSTLAVSAALPIEGDLIPGLENQSMALGATLKRSWGNALAYGEDAGSLALSDPLQVEVQFPIIHSGGDTGGVFDKGTGLGLDIGASWEGGGWNVAALVQNVFNTFVWDLQTMVYRPGRAVFNKDTNESDFEELPISEAPAELRQKIKDLGFEPVLGLGAAYAATDELTLTADVRHRSGDGLDVGPKSHLGVGAEYRPLPWLPLRAGLASITDGFQFAGGMGIGVGPVHLAFGGLLQRGDAGDGSTAMVSLSFMGG